MASILFCLFRPFHRDNVYITAKYLGKIPKILGVEMEIRNAPALNALGPVVYIANHQNSYDLFTMSTAVRPGTVSGGKKILKWIPFFGQMYWLTGNILIDRKNTSKAIDTIAVTANKIKNKKLSIWLFPEGTRSRGRGLLPLKTGAFRTAITAGVPIVPICASNQHGTIKLNRWNNGKIIIEFLEPIHLEQNGSDSLRNTANKTHSLMKAKIEELSTEALAYQNSKN
jgi:1-acyl-sn-glycerol-3-phosphate acyltransferase